SWTRSSTRSNSIWASLRAWRADRLFVGEGPFRGERPLPSGLDVPGLALPPEPLAIAHSVFALDPLDFPPIDTADAQRGAAHDDGALEQFALGEGEVEVVQLHQLQAVVGADQHRSLRECLEHGGNGRASHLTALIVVAKGDDPRRLGACSAQQVEPDPIAIIDLG